MIEIKNRDVLLWLCGWAVSPNLPVYNFEWIKDTFQFNEDFIKDYHEVSDKRYFLEVDVQYLEKY